jgi:autotransporter-associated beta strand protein
MKRIITPQLSASNAGHTCEFAQRPGIFVLFKKIVTALAVVGIAGSALAANKFWAGPSGTGSAPTSGTWDTVTANWSTTSGGTAGTTFATSDAPNFGGTDGIFIKCSTLTSGTITNNNSYTFTNDAAVTVSMVTGTPWMIAPGKTVTIGTNVTFAFSSTGGTINNGNLNFGGTIIVDNGGKLQQTANQSMQFDGSGTLIRVLTGGLLQHTGTGSNVRIPNSSGHSATLSIEGGTVAVTGAAGFLIANNAVSTGTVTVANGLLNVTNVPVTLGVGNANTDVATNNLDGGIELVRQIRTGGSLNVSIFNFNGGILKAGSSVLASTFMNGLTTANVRDGGAVVDQNGFDITIGQALVHSSIGGDAATDGGLIVTNSRIAGSLTLSNANTYNGSTVVKGGAKLVTTTRSIGAGAYSVADGGTLEVQVAAAGQSLTNSSLTVGTSGNLTNNFTLGANASTTIPAVIVNGALNLNGTVSVTVSGSGLTGPGTYLLLSYGSSSGSGSFVAGTLPAVSGFLGSITNDTTAKQLKLVYIAAPQAVKWAVSNGNWDTTTLNWQLLAGSTATNYAEGSLSAFDDSATGSSPITVTLAANRSPGGITNNSTKNYILAGSASITGSGTIIKDGSSTLTIDNSGPNVLSAVTISGGTLQVGNGDANGDLGSATVTDNSTLVFNRTDNITSAIVVSGSGSLVQNGSGILTLSAANTYSNLTIINSGQLVLANVSAAQNSTVSNHVANGLGFDSSITAATIGGLAGNFDITLNNTASAVVTLTAGGNNQATAYGGSLIGSGSLSKTGTNTLTLSGSSILSSLGAGGGTLAITDGNSTIATVNLSVGTLAISGGTTTVTSDSRISGANCSISVSGGTLNLPKLVLGSAAAGNTNNLMTVSGSAVVNQNQPGGSPAQALWIGGNNNGSGALLLKDNASWVNTATTANLIVVGNFGTGQGTLTIQDNATFNNATVMRVTDLVGNVGTVNLNGGVCSVNGFSKGAGAGTINVNGGQITTLAASANFFNGFTNTSGTNAVNLVSGRLTLDNGGFAIAVSNVLSGAGGLISQGGGTLALQMANTYTGNTVINAGTLQLVGAGLINSSSSVSNNTSSTLDVSTANTQLSIGGTLTLNDSTLIASLANTNITVGTLGTAGSANTINVSALPSIASLPATVRVIKYATAAVGLVDGGNNLTTLGVTLPSAASPQGYLTNNAVVNSIDLIITNMVRLPVITSQPVGDSAYSGGKAHFSVTLQVTNSVGLHYQWRKAGTALTDGANVFGSTSTTVQLSNITGGDAVNYDVVITNISGSVTSSPAALTFLSPTNYEAAAVAAGPVALYMFEEIGDPSTNNTIAYDYEGDLDGIYGVNSENAYNSIAGPRPTDGFPGFEAANAAGLFQGFTTNSHVTIPALNLNTNTVTLAAWVKPGTPAANAGIIFCRGSGTVAGLDLTANVDGSGNRTLGYTWNNEAGTFNWNSQLTLTNGLWSFVALVITPTNVTIDVFNTGGLQSASQAYTHVNQSFSASTLIGEDTSGNNRQFDGTVDGVAIYGKSLTQSQLQNIYGAASGISNFPPVIQPSPVSQNLYEQQTATFSGTASGSQPLSYQWQYFDVANNYFNVVNGGRISGANSSTLVITNIALTDATNFVLVVTNFYGSVTSSVVTLTVNPVGPAEAITNSTVLSAGQSWDTGTAWSDGLPASISAVSKPGSTYYIVPNGGLRTPNVGSIAQFPGNVLNVLGDGVFNATLPNADVGALILKGTGSAYTKLVLNGGEILSFTDSNGAHTIGGTEVNVVANTPIAGLSSTGGRSITINAKLTGSGSMEYIGWPNTTFQSAAVTSLNIAGTNNTFNGTWEVDSGTLVGSTLGALGTNTITVGTNGALQTAYNIQNTNGTLILNGLMNLTQNDVFTNVIINGTNLSGGTYSYATLAANYPANFPATWTAVTGAAATSASGSITVLAATIASNPTNITVAVSGNTLTLTWPADHLGWIAQSNSVSLINTNYWFDIPNSQSVTQLNITMNTALTNVFYRLRHP